MGRYYVTTPIYYVNDLPHIGHIYTTVVADVVARYRRLRGDDVHFLTGTDEHGQNIERAAARQGVEPRELADRVVERYHGLWPELGISHDDFIRTTEPRHRRGVEEMIRRLDAAGDLYSALHEGWYCPACETFYTEKELADGACPVHGTPAEWHSEENVFFRLSKYQQPLLDWLDEHPDAVRPATRRNEVRSFVEGGLRDLSVSRAGLTWGIPFPGQPGQTVYVWLDALTNYVSALGFGSDGGERFDPFWADPEATRLHLVGKDILRFHAVYWPAFLLSAGLELPSCVWAHGWWLRDQQKVSKSTGNVVRPDHLIEEFGADPLRYFLMREMVFGQDAAFSDQAFVDRFNSDLANDLGNTVSRLVTLARSAFEGRTPPEPCDDNPLIEQAGRALQSYRRVMDEQAFHRALETLWSLLAEGNQYLVEREPWHLVKREGPSSRVSRILWNGLEVVRHVATALLPFMPRLAPRVLGAIAAPVPQRLDDLVWGGMPAGAELPAPQALFPRIDAEAYLEGEPAPQESADDTQSRVAEESAMIDIEQFRKVRLQVGTVREAVRVENADRLLRLQVELADGERRQLVAGVAREYEPETLVGRQVVVVVNLEPATIRGVESQGMVLAASDGGRPVLLRPDADVPPGTPVE